jgi:hypothetical protein
MTESNDLNKRLREIINDLKQRRNRKLIQGRALTPSEQSLVERIKEVLPHLDLLSNDLAGDDDTRDYQ